MIDILESNWKDIRDEVKAVADAGKIGWTRTARTDKGVHAVSNVASMKLKIPLNNEEELRKNLNYFIPNDMSIHRILKTTQGFHAKSACTGRSYHYI